jgi:hypothetical protein
MDSAASTYEVNKEALNLIFDETKDVPRQQRMRAEAIDTKVVQSFGAATLLIGLSGVGLADEIGRGALFFYVAALLAYVVAALAAFVAFKPRDWRANNHAGWLWDNCYFRSADEIRHILNAQIREVVEHNERQINWKVAWLSAALIMTGIEGLFVAMALLTSHL